MSDNSSNKYTRIHMVKLVRCITDMGLRDCVEIVDRHLKIEEDLSNMDQAHKDRTSMQEDVLNKMISNKIKSELDKEIGRLQKIRSEI